MTKIVLQDTNSGYNLSKINSNFDAIEDYINNDVLSRQNPGGDPNQMLNDLDMNGNRVFNLPKPAALSEAVRLQDLIDAVIGDITLTASVVPFTPTGTIAATNVQAAIAEVSGDVTAESVTRAAQDVVLGNSITTTNTNLTAVTTTANNALTASTANSTAIINRLVYTVDSIAQLKATVKTATSNIRTRGYYAAGDQGGGLYYYDASDTTTTDNGGTVIVAADGGRWKIVQSTPFTVRQFGAKGDSTTNDAPAINNALAFSAMGSIVYVPPGNYRVASTITVDTGKSLVSLTLGNTFGQTSAVLIADLAVTPILNLNGGAGNGACHASGITVTRAAGTIPASSIGVIVQSSNMSTLLDMYSLRSDIAYDVDGGTSTNLGIHLTRCLSGQITSRHLQITNSVETTITECRFGRNGGGDVACVDFVAIVGTTVDTVRFIACQFNQSGGVVTQVIHFYGYVGNPNGIITFAQCHMESWSTTVVTADASSTIPRLRFIGCSINGTGAFTSVTPGNLSEFMLTGNTIDGAISLTLDQQKLSVISGNHFGGTGAILINQGTQCITGNYFDAGVTLQGSTTKTVFVGNACGTLGNTMTGTLAITGNI